MHPDVEDPTEEPTEAPAEVRKGSSGHQSHGILSLKHQSAKALAHLLEDTREHWEAIVHFNKRHYNAHDRSKKHEVIRLAHEQLHRDDNIEAIAKEMEEVRVCCSVSAAFTLCESMRRRKERAQEQYPR